MSRLRAHLLSGLFALTTGAHAVELPSAAVPLVQRYTGTFEGQFVPNETFTAIPLHFGERAGVSGGIELTLSGRTPSLSFRGTSGDNLFGNCGGTIGAYKGMTSGRSAFQPRRTNLLTMTFAFDGTACGIRANTVELEFTRQISRVHSIVVKVFDRTQFDTICVGENCAELEKSYYFLGRFKPAR